jgi:hypothetical protein
VEPLPWSIAAIREILVAGTRQGYVLTGSGRVVVFGVEVASDVVLEVQRNDDRGIAIAAFAEGRPAGDAILRDWAQFALVTGFPVEGTTRTEEPDGWRYVTTTGVEVTSTWLPRNPGFPVRVTWSDGQRTVTLERAP